ncbi:MAG: hypothetical protein KGS45_12170 [Planctomycetes bacterium]|nr:hypothetical protein [Planctomycetota bacterium]
MSKSTRPLTDEERTLLRWMLENGGDEARAFLPQLERARATTWKCTCGCASLELNIRGYQTPDCGFNPIVDFGFGTDENGNPHDIFVYELSGVLGGIEVGGFGVNAPRWLPTPEELRPHRK